VEVQCALVGMKVVHVLCLKFCVCEHVFEAMFVHCLEQQLGDNGYGD